MKRPWQDKTGLSKFAAIFATILMISLGLCGANFALFARFGSIAGPAPQPGTTTWPTPLLMATGTAELAGIATGLFGLVIVGLAVLVSWVASKLSSTKNDLRND